MSYLTDTTQAATSEALLIKSNRIYREIEIIYQQLTGNLVGNVELATDTLNTLFKNALTIDDLISERLGQNEAVTDSAKKLLRQREELLTSLHQNNRHLAQKAENIKSLLRHEITTLATNQNALRSYKPVDTERKGIVRHAF